jgi:L-fuconolactonase
VTDPTHALALIDSHVHFWQPDRLRYAWLEGLPALNRPFLPADLPTLPEAELVGLVFVQADCDPAQGLDEARWVSELAQADPRIQGIVAFAPLESPDAARPVLEALRALPLVKGIRRLIQSEAAGFAAQPNFIDGVQMLAEYGFSFDLCVRHWQLPETLTLVSACPNVRFVLDHLGKPNIAAAELDPWRAQLAALAQRENVWCKLSGLVTEAAPGWQPADLAPYIEHALACFGAERLMFGSDWPVVNLAGDGGRWLSAARAALAGLDAAAQRAIFHDNARAFYRLDGATA